MLGLKSIFELNLKSLRISALRTSLTRKQNQVRDREAAVEFGIKVDSGNFNCGSFYQILEVTQSIPLGNKRKIKKWPCTSITFHFIAGEKLYPVSLCQRCLVFSFVVEWNTVALTWRKVVQLQVKSQPLPIQLESKQATQTKTLRISLIQHIIYSKAVFNLRDFKPAVSQRFRHTESSQNLLWPLFGWNIIIFKVHKSLVLHWETCFQHITLCVLSTRSLFSFRHSLRQIYSPKIVTAAGSWRVLNKIKAPLTLFWQDSLPNQKNPGAKLQELLML